jgi:hypothetical protein
VYHDLKGNAINTNQYSVTDHFRKSMDGFPGVYFIYDISPIMVGYRTRFGDVCPALFRTRDAVLYPCTAPRGPLDGSIDHFQYGGFYALVFHPLCSCVLFLTRRRGKGMSVGWHTVFCQRVDSQRLLKAGVANANFFILATLFPLMRGMLDHPLWSFWAAYIHIPLNNSLFFSAHSCSRR